MSRRRGPEEEPALITAEAATARHADSPALWVEDLYALHQSVEETHWWFRGRRAILLAFADRVLGGDPGAFVIDVGCGTGGNAAAFGRTYRALGIDPSEEAIRLARARYPGHRFLAGHAPADLGEDAGRADLFVLTDVLEHVRDDFSLLSRILAAARPGAHVLITVPADESLWSPHDVTLGHFRRYDAARLARTWERMPVQVRLLSHFNARLYPAVKAVRRVRRLIGSAAGRGGTDLRVPPPPLNRALQALFAGEAAALVRAVDAGATPFARGASLIALLRREDGDATPRSRPADVRPDRHDPATRSR